MKVQITNGMFMAIIINLVYAKAIGLTQGSMAREVGSDMWIATIFAVLQGLLVMTIVIYLIKKMPDKDIIQHSEKLVGKWFSKLVAALVLIFFLFAFGGILATFVYHIKDFFLPESPLLVIVLAALFIGVYGIFFGLEVISRMALLGVFSVLCLNILIILGSVQDFDVRELLPTFQSGFFNTLWASRHYDADWALATMMATMLLPYVKNDKTWTRSGMAGIIYGGLFVLIWPILEAGVLTAEVAAQYFVSCMQMARSAQIGVFFHRYEMIMIAFFALSSITQIMITLLCSSIALQRLLGLKDYRPVIIPTALMLGGFGYWFVFDHARAIELLETYWIWVALGITISLPILILLLRKIFKKKVKDIEVSENTKA
ncbi:GerAB/ArcD/ProY family transporter [Robertmurraya massiliosenegalensis]|uniref:GerAB/ArcD/ProY family transporter n=1 Tax=Robertmurraya massiliosenegalensis TaxID=1287657 RepID=UPI0002F1345A|nr:GerAB/ArcD/ProY family transporter [Robertmurraya massiliosenegalensis]